MNSTGLNCGIRFLRSSAIMVAGALLGLSPLGSAAGEQAPERLNILLIVADDFGYGDLSIHGCRDIPTPHIDSIAVNGVRCSHGYVSAPQCSPTRAGLMTGRYQQRFGHEHNSAHANSNLALSEKTLSERLKTAGYRTGMVGKWHLGTSEGHQPLDRGFEEFFGFIGGSNRYLPQGPARVVPRILRGREEANEKEYLTDAFAREAVAYVDRHAREPFFLYLAFNAPHGPLQASDKYLDDWPISHHIVDMPRSTGILPLVGAYHSWGSQPSRGAHTPS